MMGMMWPFGMMGGFGFVFLGIFFMIAMSMMRQGRGFGGKRSGESPKDILKKRYAKGEISREEFKEMKKELG